MFVVTKIILVAAPADEYKTGSAAGGPQCEPCLCFISIRGVGWRGGRGGGGGGAESQDSVSMIFRRQRRAEADCLVDNNNNNNNFDL